MDFVGLFSELAKSKKFEEKIAIGFTEYCKEKQIIPDSVQRNNHAVTYRQAAMEGAGFLAEIIGEEMEKHPYLAKQAAKLIGLPEGKGKGTNGQV